MMIINSQFRFFQEPYTNKKIYWLVNIEKGDVYKINKKTYMYLKNINKKIPVNCTKIIFELKKIKVIENDK